MQGTGREIRRECWWRWARHYLIGALAFYFVRGANQAPQPAAETQTGLGPEERAYAANVGVDRLEISRAENFLHQEVTTISGEITNGGNRALAGVELTIEFYDTNLSLPLRFAVAPIFRRDSSFLFHSWRYLFPMWC